MQRRKLGMAGIWMVCLLGMVAVVWSRPPMGSSRSAEHPQLALAAQDVPNPDPQDPAFEPQAPVPMQAEAVQPPPAQERAGAECPALPSGEWVREITPYKISFKFEGNRLFATLKGRVDEDMVVEQRFAGDYHLTKDSMLYGIITSAEIVISPENSEEQVEADQAIQEFFDQPFALRYRLDEDALTIKDFKFGHLADGSANELKKHIVGCYHRAPAPQPSPK